MNTSPIPRPDRGTTPDRGTPTAPVGEKELARAIETLKKYKQGKANLERRMVEDELWWELRHWEVIRRRTDPARRGPEPSSAWLFNAILNKHADAMDNLPEPLVLPREPSDQDSARLLSSVLPVVLDNCDFPSVWSADWWEKLKHGTAAYGVFWNSRKENGLGDVDVRQLDLLKLFWEPGVTDIQQSGNLFLVELADRELLENQYPQLAGSLGGDPIDVKQYLYDDSVDTSQKALVVDWYYKVAAPDGRTLLHYAKFVGNTLLYASENDPATAASGWYEDGLYPVVLDVLFPEKGTPAGFGFVSVCKDPQLYIDKLYANILESSLIGTKKRFFAGENTNINEEEFLDWQRPIVHVSGALDDLHLKEIVTRPLDGVYFSVLNAKIDEMKDTAANRDVNAGGTGSGVTAASAIAALQEAGNKVSRDMLSTSYRAFVAVCSLCVSRMAQFYDEARVFRVTGPDGAPSFAQLSNAALRPQTIGAAADGSPLFRKPVFDLKISAQKKNPFSRMEQNERAKELYALGFFNPEKAQEALAALEMMDFEGIDRARDQIRRGGDLMALCRKLSQQVEQLFELVERAGVRAAGEPRQTRAGDRKSEDEGSESKTGKQTLAASVAAARRPDRGYLQALVRRSQPGGEGTA